MSKSTGATKEPAIKSYFFGKGYTDLGNVIKESWKRNIDSAKDFFAKINTSGEWWEVLLSILFFGGAGVSVVTFGLLFFVMVSILHISLLLSFFSVIYILFTFVWVIERIFLLAKHFFVACPNCHAKNSLPEYLCDNCGRAHKKLTPNSYGIIYHKCTCGHKLPATFFVNRGRLQAKCPDCSLLLHREHIESNRIFIPILGGPSSGKTAFMFSVVRKIIDESASELGFVTEFIDKTTESEYIKVIEQLKKGIVPEKTTQNIPKAFNLALKINGKTKWLLYIYDPAGEVYQNTNDLSGLQYHDYLSGLIFVIDPFSIPKVRRTYETELSRKWSDVKPSQLSAEDALSRILLTMEESFGLSKTAKFKKPLAVVISKIDAFDLEKVLGETAVTSAHEKTPDISRIEVRNKLIIEQLHDWNEDALLHQIKTRFSNVRYFSCSALGRIPDSSQSNDLSSSHVLDSILWLCHSVNSKDFNLKS